ncbi:hypothetical protein ACFL25_00555 [Patescibacteria group bacterium]
MTADNVTEREARPTEPVVLIKTGVVPQSDSSRLFYLTREGVPVDCLPSAYEGENSPYIIEDRSGEITSLEQMREIAKGMRDARQTRT